MSDRDRERDEIEQVIAAIRPAIRALDCGALHCRYCPAGSANGWKHDSSCPYELSVQEVEDARAALTKLEALLRRSRTVLSSGGAAEKDTLVEPRTPTPFPPSPNECAAAANAARSLGWDSESETLGGWIRRSVVKGAAEGRSCAVPDELEAAKRAMDEYVPSTSAEPLAKRISDEMHDYMTMAHEVSKVYDTLTVGFFSKPNTAAHHVIARVEEIQQKDIDEAVAEALGEPAESRALMGQKWVSRVTGSCESELSVLGAGVAESRAVLPEPPEDFDWALDRVQKMAASALADSRVYGRKLLKGFGYPNEIFSRAQDWRALSILLAALSPDTAEEKS